MIYVVPTKVWGANGAVRDVSSPLIAPITVPYAERKLIDTVALILQAASKTSGGARIDVGNLPYSPTTMVAFSVSGESARDSLAKLFAKVSTTPVSYRLLFDPVLRTYMLNIQVVQQPIPAADQAVSAPQQSVSNAAERFFAVPKP